jgi:tetrahydromethanopterin S-methyltransferase subunit C
MCDICIFGLRKSLLLLITAMVTLGPEVATLGQTEQATETLLVACGVSQIQAHRIAIAILAVITLTVSAVCAWLALR